MQKVTGVIYIKGNTEFITDHAGESCGLTAAGAVGPQHYCGWWGHFCTACTYWQPTHRPCRFSSPYTAPGKSH